MPHGPIDGGPEVGDVAFAGDELVEVKAHTDGGYAVGPPRAPETATRLVAGDALRWAMPVTVHPAPHCMYFLSTDISNFAADAHTTRAERWASPRYSVELTAEHLVLVDADGDRVVLELDARERHALGSALGGFRRRRSAMIPVAPSGMCEVTVTDTHVELSVLIDPTGEMADLVESKGPLAAIAALNGLAAKEEGGRRQGQLPAGIQVTDVTIPRAVARQLSAALSRPIIMQH